MQSTSIKITQVDNTIQYGEDADVRTHDFEQNEDGFDADRLLGEGGWGIFQDQLFF